MQTSTTFDIAGMRITQNLGVVRGIVVRSPTIGQGLMALYQFDLRFHAKALLARVSYGRFGEWQTQSNQPTASFKSI